jgi:hypothetical protein
MSKSETVVVRAIPTLTDREGGMRAQVTLRAPPPAVTPQGVDAGRSDRSRAARAARTGEASDTVSA